VATAVEERGGSGGGAQRWSRQRDVAVGALPHHQAAVVAEHGSGAGGVTR
jgi:hypothetical protein